MNLYQELLMDHYRHPRNQRKLAAPDFSSGEYNPSCGDSVSFEGNIQDNKLVEIAFIGKGCVISQATASLLSEYCKNKDIHTILAVDKKVILELIKIDLGPTRLACALLPLQALHAGLQRYKDVRA